MTDSLSSLVLIDIFTDGDPIAVEAGQPLLYVGDLRVIHGDGVLKTLLVKEGRTCNTDRYEERFVSSALMLDLPTSNLGQWRVATEVALRELRDRLIKGDATLRWVCSRGRESTGKPTGYVLANSTEGMTENRLKPVSVMLVECGFSLDLGSRVPWALIGTKALPYTANVTALRHAKSKGFDDVIFTSAKGKSLEGPASTIIVQRDSELLIPNPGEGVLPGMTQAASFETAANYGWKVTPTIPVPGNLFAADAAWLVSSVRTAVVAKPIDDEPIRQLDAVAEKEFRDLCDEALATQQGSTQQSTKLQCAK